MNQAFAHYRKPQNGLPTHLRCSPRIQILLERLPIRGLGSRSGALWCSEPDNRRTRVLSCKIGAMQATHENALAYCTPFFGVLPGTLTNFFSVSFEYASKPLARFMNLGLAASLCKIQHTCYFVMFVTFHVVKHQANTISDSEM